MSSFSTVVDTIRQARGERHTTYHSTFFFRNRFNVVMSYKTVGHRSAEVARIEVYKPVVKTEEKYSVIMITVENATTDQAAYIMAMISQWPFSDDPKDELLVEISSYVDQCADEQKEIGRLAYMELDAVWDRPKIEKKLPESGK